MRCAAGPGGGLLPVFRRPHDPAWRLPRDFLRVLTHHSGERGRRAAMVAAPDRPPDEETPCSDALDAVSRSASCWPWLSCLPGPRQPALVESSRPGLARCSPWILPFGSGRRWQAFGLRAVVQSTRVAPASPVRQTAPQERPAVLSTRAARVPTGRGALRPRPPITAARKTRTARAVIRRPHALAPFPGPEPGSSGKG